MARKGFTAPLFHDEAAARTWFKATRWPDGPVCPKCGSAKHYATKKIGVYRCGSPTCRKDFTVLTGTVMERSHAKLTDWAVAFHLAASSKKGFSAHQLHRELGCQYNTTWFMFHRVREAMRRGGLVCRRLAARARLSKPTKRISASRKIPNSPPIAKAHRRRAVGVAVPLANVL
jgi:transposase-like protein